LTVQLVKEASRGRYGRCTYRDGSLSLGTLNRLVGISMLPTNTLSSLQLACVRSRACAIRQQVCDSTRSQGACLFALAAPWDCAYYPIIIPTARTSSNTTRADMSIVATTVSCRKYHVPGYSGVDTAHIYLRWLEEKDPAVLCGLCEILLPEQLAHVRWSGTII
jgi:hypothetical protein